VRSAHRAPAWLRELAVGVAVLLAVGAVRLVASYVPTLRPPDPATDVYAAAQLRDVRQALDLFARERGNYPHRLEDMVDDRWLAPSQLHVPGYAVQYRVVDGGREYELGLKPDR
jgi:hypothetical protein